MRQTFPCCTYSLFISRCHYLLLDFLFRTSLLKLKPGLRDGETSTESDLNRCRHIGNVRPNLEIFTKSWMYHRCMFCLLHDVEFALYLSWHSWCFANCLDFMITQDNIHLLVPSSHLQHVLGLFFPLISKHLSNKLSWKQEMLTHVLHDIDISYALRNGENSWSWEEFTTNIYIELLRVLRLTKAFQTLRKQELHNPRSFIILTGWKLDLLG